MAKKKMQGQTKSAVFIDEVINTTGHTPSGLMVGDVASKHEQPWVD